jgi:hypothetical protein
MSRLDEGHEVSCTRLAVVVGRTLSCYDGSRLAWRKELTDFEIARLIRELAGGIHTRG